MTKQEILFSAQLSLIQTKHNTTALTGMGMVAANKACDYRGVDVTYSEKDFLLLAKEYDEIGKMYESLIDDIQNTEE